MTKINRLLAGGDNMIKTLEENIHAVIGDTTEYQISELNSLLEENQKELISLANKEKDYESLADEYNTNHYNLQMVIAVGFKLNSENGQVRCFF